MRIRTAVFIAVGAVAVAGTSWWAAHPAPHDWTTSSAEALAEFRAGREAQQKIYSLEAIEHYRAALAKDPGFVMARLQLAEALASLGQSAAAKAELEQVLKADVSRLQPRERRAIELVKLRHAGKTGEVLALLLRSEREFPRDPLYPRALATYYFFERGDLDEAMKWFQRTLEIAPNDAQSYNLLGYLEMGRGDFAAAEANLKRYAFIVPDQANPHDSLGELYTVVGRYDEAIAEFRRALDVNPRFFPAWDHIARVEVLRGNEGPALAALSHSFDLAGTAASEREVRTAAAQAWVASIRGDTAAMIAAARRLPVEAKMGDIPLLRHMAAVAQGDYAAAERIEAEVSQGSKGTGESGPAAQAIMHVLKAGRLLAEGRAREAAAEAREADTLFNFTAEGGQAILKLMARSLQAQALLADGQTMAAREVVAAVAAVNPRFPGLDELRAEVRVR